MFNPKEVRDLLSDLMPLEEAISSEDKPVETSDVVAIKSDINELGSKTCQTCGEVFEELNYQRQHFKLDWHRFNVKQKLRGEPVISEQEFDDLVIRKSQSHQSETQDDNDDLASLSGSESEGEEEEELNFGREGDFRVFMVNANQKVVSFHKCICPDPSAPSLPPSLLAHTGGGLKSCVVMLGGGHFAAAVFEADKPVLHKTFHCYTVRAKQGGGQSSADNRSGTSHPKSAGASLRRYNEASLANHVRDIMASWEENLRGCSLIFYRAAGNNKKLLFAAPLSSKDRPAILDRKDPRVRSLPFPTRRATFAEVKRIHALLTTFDLHGPKDEFVAELRRNNPSSSPTKAGKGVSPRKSHIHRSKSREKLTKVRPISEDLSEEELKKAGSETDDDLTDSLALEIQHQRLVDGLADQFETRIEGVYQLDQDLISACMGGDRNALTKCIQAVEGADGEGCVSDLFNRTFGASRSTPLHLASRHGHNQVVAQLLEMGSDPTSKDRQKKTPYMVAQSKETRNVFRRFQAQNPDACNWSAAQVPTTDLLTPEEEARQANKKKEKRKAQKQAKKARDQEAKKVEAKKDAESQEKEHFLRLSDREKRALAAERRLLTQENTSVVAQRCFLCAKDITGKVPFEYNDNRFCSPACVRQHRKLLESS